MEEDEMDGTGMYAEADGAAVFLPSSVAPPPGADNPYNHRLTVSLDMRGPHLCVRGQNADDIAEAIQELEARGVTAILAGIWGQMNAQMNSARGVPQAPAPQPQAAPQQWQQPAPQQSYAPAMPGPGVPGQAPAPWQNAGAPAAPASPVPPGWYRLNVPFKSKPAFDGIVQQYNFRKGDPNNGGQLSFQRDTKSWYCAPDIVGAFQNFQPVPA